MKWQKDRIYTGVLYGPSYKFRAGDYEIDGHTYYFRSRFEYLWACYLQFLLEAGEIVGWEYEPERFGFEGIRSGTVYYIPDFRVFYPNDEHLWHETKGALQQKDVTKFRRMAKYFPKERIVLVMQRIPKKGKQLILLEKAMKYVERVIDGTAQLKTVGIR